MIVNRNRIDVLEKMGQAGSEKVEYHYRFN